MFQLVGSRLWDAADGQMYTLIGHEKLYLIHLGLLERLEAKGSAKIPFNSETFLAQFLNSEYPRISYLTFQARTQLILVA